jgi:8-oxo-dGTP pyrophosphatase MutT (NUDIX family)
MLNIQLPQKISDLNIQAGEIWQGAVCAIISQDHLIFIQRSLTMPSHSGQIAFFGGNKKSFEVEPLETALREFHEETSLSPQPLIFKGYLNGVYTSYAKLFVPVVFECSQISPQIIIQMAKSNGEWDEIFAVPMRLFCNFHRWSYGERVGQNNFPIYFFHLMNTEIAHSSKVVQDSKLLWGATGRMVFELISLYSK